MINFALVCQQEHRFEGWFKGNAEFDQQSASGAIECPYCGSNDVRKAVMAPAIARRHKEPEAATASMPEAASPPAPQPVVQAAAVMHLIRALHRHVEANCENVGERFSEEARKIHNGDAEERGIYGQASREEMEDLLDEGIEVGILPPMPELDG